MIPGNKNPAFVQELNGIMQTAASRRQEIKETLNSSITRPKTPSYSTRTFGLGKPQRSQKTPKRFPTTLRPTKQTLQLNYLEPFVGESTNLNGSFGEPLQQKDQLEEGIMLADLKHQLSEAKEENKMLLESLELQKARSDEEIAFLKKQNEEMKQQIIDILFFFSFFSNVLFVLFAFL